MNENEKQCKTEKAENVSDPFSVDKQFWNTLEGRIIQSIVLGHLSEKQKIAEDSKIVEKLFNKSYGELLSRRFIEEKKDGKILVKRQLYCQCMSYFLDQQKMLVNWAQEWKKQQRIDPIGRSNASQFYLVGKSIFDFCSVLIQQAKRSILVVDPCFKKGSIHDSLLEMTEKGVNVCVMTSVIEPEQVKVELVTQGVKICEDKSIHAKLIVVDDRIALLSSTSFLSGTSKEASWDAGIVTMDKDTVMAISRSIIKKYNDNFIASRIT